MRMEKAVLTENISRPIIVHDHIHLSRFDQIGIDVDAEEALTSDLTNTFAQRLALSISRCVAPEYLRADTFDELIHRDDQKPPGATCRIENPFASFQIEHSNGHALYIAW